MATKSIQARFPVRICISGFLSFLLLSTIIAPARADLVWGANGHPLVSYPGVSIERQLDYIRDLGMTSYRVDVNSILKVNALEALIVAGKARGIDILPILIPPADLNTHTPDELYTKAHAFAVTFVSRFRADIRIWELGNELENYAIIQPCEMRDDGTQYPCEWGPAGGIGKLEYYGPRWKKVSAVLKGLSDGITSVDPKIRKAMGTAGWGHTGAFARMQEDGIQWDISVWHMYGQDPEWAFKKLAKYGRPIWVTEFGHPRGSSRDGAAKQASGLVRWMKRLSELSDTYRVEAAHIYELMDETYWAPNFEAYMGLVLLESDGRRGWRPGEPKAAYFSVRELIRGVEFDKKHPGRGLHHGKLAPKNTRLPEKK